MKKIYLGLMCLMCGGCAFITTQTTTIGDVTAYTQNGEILQKWEKVVLQEKVGAYTDTNAFKTFGINFYDNKSGKHIIIGNAVPYIIEYTTQSTSHNSYDEQKTINTSNESKHPKEVYINQWKMLSSQEQTLKSLMKKTDKTSIEYQNLKEKHKGIVMQMDYVHNKLLTLFNYDILAMGF